jgi:hypothetical protein
MVTFLFVRVPSIKEATPEIITTATVTMKAGRLNFTSVFSFELTGQSSGSMRNWQRTLGEIYRKFDQLVFSYPRGQFVDHGSELFRRTGSPLYCASDAK